MFADLTPHELKAVQEYLHGIPEMNLADDHTKKMKKNTIPLAELELPRGMKPWKLLIVERQDPRVTE